MIPNLLGNIPDWIEIKKISKKYNLKVRTKSKQINMEIIDTDSKHETDGSSTSGEYPKNYINYLGIKDYKINFKEEGAIPLFYPMNKNFLLRNKNIRPF